MQARSYYPPYSTNEQRPPSMPHRPSSSGGFNHFGQQSVNRSYHKMPGQAPQPGYNYQGNQRNNNNNFSRSRVSMGSSQVSHLSQLANEPDVFPEELVFLLRS